ncbi:MAG: hypothetical protein CVU59_11255, partial [Deltaproteobacteria bacterium HGW-Deltaproteobacteria-17]
MASKLSSILVKLGLIPIRKLDQAFQNQVINGGTLDSALLELGLIREKDLIRVLVEASDLPSIQLAELAVDDSRALVSIFPQKLALRYQVIPVSRVGEQVGVLVNAEFDKNKIEEIGFMLGVSLIARVVPEPRLLAFASEIYGFELEERQKRILSRLGPPAAYPDAFVKPWISPESSGAAGAGPQAAAPDAPVIAETPSNSDHDITPVPEFSYVERQISPNILVPTISRERRTGEQERALQPVVEKRAPAEYDSNEDLEEGEDGLHDAVTRPGFTFPEQKKQRSPFSESGPIGPLPEGLPRFENGDPEFTDSGTVRQVTVDSDARGSDEAPGTPRISRIEDAMTEPMGSAIDSIPMRAERLPSDTTQTDAISFEAPAPVVEAPAPVMEAPAPVVEAPAPVMEAPAPVVKPPAPVVKPPAPRPA